MTRRHRLGALPPGRLSGWCALSLILLTSIGTRGSAGLHPVEADATVEPARAVPGAELIYRIEIRSQSGYELTVPEPAVEIGGLAVVDQGVEEALDEEGRRLTSRWYRLQAERIGSFVLPSMPVTYRRAGTEAEAETVATPALYVEVVADMAAARSDGDIRDIKPLLQARRPVPWRWIIGAALIALVAALLVWVRRRRSRRRGAGAPPTPAHQLALEAIGALRREALGSPDAFREQHYRLSVVVRGYVEARFGLNATDLTSEEILARLPSVAEVGEQEARSLEAFLRQTDRVKFAEYRPSPGAVGSTFDLAERFVSHTRPAEGEGPAGVLERAA